MKNWRNTNFFCLTRLITQMTDPLKFWHMYDSHLYFFLPNFVVCTSPEHIRSRLINWSVLHGESKLVCFNATKNFLVNEIHHFSRLSHITDCHTYLSSPLYIICSLFRYYCLFLNAIFHKTLKNKIVKPFFIRM